MCHCVNFNFYISLCDEEFLGGVDHWCHSLSFTSIGVSDNWSCTGGAVEEELLNGKKIGDDVALVHLQGVCG